jgi:hypothetical protein
MQLNQHPFGNQISTQKNDHNLSLMRPFRKIYKKSPYALLQIQAAYNNSSISPIERADLSAILPVGIQTSLRDVTKETTGALQIPRINKTREIVTGNAYQRPQC